LQIYKTVHVNIRAMKKLAFCLLLISVAFPFELTFSPGIKIQYDGANYFNLAGVGVDFSTDGKRATVESGFSFYIEPGNTANYEIYFNNSALIHFRGGVSLYIMTGFDRFIDSRWNYQFSEFSKKIGFRITH